MRRGAIGALLAAVILGSWTGSAAAKPTPTTPLLARQVVTAANIFVEPGATISAIVTSEYPAYCEVLVGMANPYLSSVQGVPVIFLPSNILGRGFRCEIGKASLRMQTDGNLVVYDENGVARWAASWYADVINKGQRAHFQGFDGNFVVYNNFGSFFGALWDSHTCCRSGAKLAVQADGNVVVYDSNLQPLWHTGTNH
jgi:hypothetical protein